MLLLLAENAGRVFWAKRVWWWRFVWRGWFWASVRIWCGNEGSDGLNMYTSQRCSVEMMMPSWSPDVWIYNAQVCKQSRALITDLSYDHVNIEMTSNSITNRHQSRMGGRRRGLLYMLCCWSQPLLFIHAQLHTHRVFVCLSMSMIRSVHTSYSSIFLCNPLGWLKRESTD